VARTPCFAPLHHTREIAANNVLLASRWDGLHSFVVVQQNSSTSAAHPVVFTPLCRDYLFRTITLSQVLM
jgi:hypothetical protein